MRFGARPDNDLPAIMDEFGPKVHFLHLRNVKRDGNAIAGSFYEAEHLGGDTDMVALIAAVLREENRRAREGREDAQILLVLVPARDAVVLRPGEEDDLPGGRVARAPGRVLGRGLGGGPAAESSGQRDGGAGRDPCVHPSHR